MAPFDSKFSLIPVGGSFVVETAWRGVVWRGVGWCRPWWQSARQTDRKLIAAEPNRRFIIVSRTRFGVGAFMTAVRCDRFRPTYSKLEFGTFPHLVILSIALEVRSASEQKVHFT